ncbi:MAG: hypothetical protein ACLP9Y_34365 [Mycobacterium sp.]
MTETAESTARAKVDLDHHSPGLSVFDAARDDDLFNSHPSIGVPASGMQSWDRCATRSCSDFRPKYGP